MQSRWARDAVNIVVALAVLAGAFVFYSVTGPTDVAWMEGAEYQRRVATTDIGNGPWERPLFIVLSQPFLMLPWGDVATAYRTSPVPIEGALSARGSVSGDIDDPRWTAAVVSDGLRVWDRGYDLRGDLGGSLTTMSLWLNWANKCLQASVTMWCPPRLAPRRWSNFASCQSALIS